MFAESVKSICGDIRRYENTIREMGWPRDIGFFPQRVPDDAESVRFYERPGFARGGAALYLLVKTRQGMARIKREALSAAEAVKSSKEPLGGYCETRDGYCLAMGFDAVFGLRGGEWVYYICANERCRDGSWNHGHIAGVAVNEMSGTAVYYDERW